jgi:hypothetical protein
MISAKLELELLDDELLPRLPEVVPLEPVDVALLLEESLLVELVLDPDDTESPGERLSSDTIVPLMGARSRVCLRAVLALCKLALAL